MNLMVDDVKTFSGMDLIARNYNAAFKVLIALNVSHLYLDFDLGSKNGNTGETLLLKLFEISAVPQYIQLISYNPVGTKRMEAVLTDHGFKKNNNDNRWSK